MPECCSLPSELNFIVNFSWLAFVIVKVYIALFFLFVLFPLLILASNRNIFFDLNFIVSARELSLSVNLGCSLMWNKIFTVFITWAIQWVVKIARLSCNCERFQLRKRFFHERVKPISPFYVFIILEKKENLRVVKILRNHNHLVMRKFLSWNRKVLTVFLVSHHTTNSFTFLLLLFCALISSFEGWMSHSP